MPKHNTRQSSIERLEEVMNRLTQGHNNLTQGQNTLTQNHVALAQAQSLTNSKIDSILERLAALTMIPSSPKSPPTSPPSTSPPSPFWPHMKLDIPRFDGQDPLWWIFKITQFFDYQCVPDAEHLTIASFYMDGSALS